MLDRPESLRADTISKKRTSSYTYFTVPLTFISDTLERTRLLTAKTITRAIQTLMAALPEKDSLFSVTRCKREP